MRKLIIAAAVAIACSTSFATNKPVPQPTGGSVTQSQTLQVNPLNLTTVNANPTVNVNASPVINAGTQTSTTTNLSTSTSLSTGGVTVNNNAAEQPTDIRIRNTPNAMAYAAPPSATCVVTTGGSVSLPGFGGGISTGVIDKGCNARENARFLANVGATLAAVRVLCRADADVAAEVPECGDISADHVRAANDKIRQPVGYVNAN